jgi:hypothetical protein
MELIHELDSEAVGVPICTRHQATLSDLMPPVNELSCVFRIEEPLPADKAADDAELTDSVLRASSAIRPWGPAPQRREHSQEPAASGAMP